MFIPRLTLTTAAILALVIYSNIPEQSTAGKWVSYPLTFLGFNVHRMHFTVEFLVYALAISVGLELVYTLGPNATWQKIQEFLSKQRGYLEGEDATPSSSGSSTPGSATPNSSSMTNSVRRN